MTGGGVHWNQFIYTQPIAKLCIGGDATLDSVCTPPITLSNSVCVGCCPSVDIAVCDSGSGPG